MKRLVIAALLAAACTPAFAYQGNIKGTFNGWNGDSVYQLTDGHVIKQSTYAYDYCYAYQPEIVIFTEGGQLKAKTSCDDEIVDIEVLK